MAKWTQQSEPEMVRWLNELWASFKTLPLIQRRRVKHWPVWRKLFRPWLFDLPGVPQLAADMSSLRLDVAAVLNKSTPSSRPSFLESITSTPEHTTCSPVLLAVVQLTAPQAPNTLSPVEARGIWAQLKAQTVKTSPSLLWHPVPHLSPQDLTTTGSVTLWTYGDHSSKGKTMGITGVTEDLQRFRRRCHTSRVLGSSMTAPGSGDTPAQADHS